jgi:hypothetical protein
MRLLFPVMMSIAATASAQPAIVTAPTARQSTVLQSADCPGATNHFAREGRMWREKPVGPQKLAELPAAESYAAVYRLDERGCMIPLKYRDVRR